MRREDSFAAQQHGSRNLPTIGETLPGYQFPMWVAVFASSKTPKPIVDKLSAAIAKAVKSDALQMRFKELMVEPVGSTPQDLDTFVDGQLAFNREAIEKANISVSK
jgi:tripartite-type tricarboxylate transporter receptor subunit TctC